MKAKNQLESMEDERKIGNAIIVTVNYGWSFEPSEHEGVKGFDTIREFKAANVYPCSCSTCLEHIGAGK